MNQKWTVVYYMTERGDIPVGKRILLLHAFYKKTQKTPQKEIATALSRLREYEQGK